MNWTLKNQIKVLSAAYDRWSRKSGLLRLGLWINSYVEGWVCRLLEGPLPVYSICGCTEVHPRTFRLRTQ